MSRIALYSIMMLIWCVICIVSAIFTKWPLDFQAGAIVIGTLVVLDAIEKKGKE